MFSLLLCASCFAISDLDVLDAFYEATNGEYWSVNTNWTNTDPCTRFGVSCDSNNRVSTLYLQGNNITGELPRNFGYLTKLMGLDLTGNSLSGTLPESMANMKDLFAMSVSLSFSFIKIIFVDLIF